MAGQTNADYVLTRMLIQEAADYTSADWRLEEIDERGFLSIAEIDAALVQAANLVLEGEVAYRSTDEIVSLVTADVPEGMESDFQEVTNVMRLMRAPKDLIVLLERDRHTVLKRGRCVEEAQTEVERFLGRPFQWEKVDQNDVPDIRTWDVTRYVALWVPDRRWTIGDAELALEVGEEESFWFRREIEEEEEERDAA